MSHEATLRRMYDLINAGDIDAVSRIMADDFLENEEIPGIPPTKDGVTDFFRMMRRAFPDLTMTVEDVVDGGDKLVARARLTGTHEGEFMGMSATGRAVNVQLIDIMRFAADGLVHEHWGITDQMAMMEQLGAGAS